MRISLLLEREPFPSILERTLGNFWQSQHGQEFTVQWNPATVDDNCSRWLCNHYLNAIFPPEIDRTALEPIRREFSRSTVAWRRPLQRAYVNMALSNSMAGWFKHAELAVSPRLDEHADQLIVAGNHKIRLLNHREKRVTAIAKVGADPSFLENEISTRETARSHGVKVPALHESHAADGWFVEEYIIGTPINRLPLDEASKHSEESFRQLIVLNEATRQSEKLTDYVDLLAHRIETRLYQVACISDEQRSQIKGIAEKQTLRTLEHAADCAEINTAITHGDFQRANILAVDGETYIIDWESAGRRQMFYDTQVIRLSTRICTQGLALRMQEYFKEPPANVLEPQVFEDEQCYFDVFMLEELERHLHENSHAEFHRPGDGLTQFLVEAEQWVAA